MFKNEKYHNFISYWLISLITLIVLIIMVGGLTRLTDSGLSITKWEVFKGILPPMNQDQWEKYFLEYKSIPQYILLNSNMTLNEFKFIFFWEYIHRLLGRLIGLLFFIPFIFLIFKNKLNSYLKFRLSSVSVFILLQGFVGWYMVKSGLTENVTVSHYRLSLHLFIAFIILSSLIWIYMNIYFQTNKIFFQLDKNFIHIKILLLLIFFQIIIGAFVSGLDAGKIYQTWPLMNESYFPSDNFSDNLFNFEDPSFVQFLHRNIAYVIFIFLIFLQVLLGILILFSNVNIYLASLHQVSSIFLIVSSLNLYFRSIRTN
jgi:cytochrome c oxidase assembly protein subunit 15